MDEAARQDAARRDAARRDEALREAAPSERTRADANAGGVDTLLIEPFGGMAGDMLLAALLDLGDPRWSLDDLRAMARALVPGEARLECERVWRGSLSGLHLDVSTPESGAPPHRGLRELREILERSDLPRSVVERAGAVLLRIAIAEGRVHGCAPEEIHFHEIGAVDSLIDVAGACLALERLGVERVLATAPLVGSGSVRCAHGEMPVPAPAVAELLKGRACTLAGEGERLTPTGAALLVEFCERFEPAGAFVAHAVGYGAGTRDPRSGPPNIVRVQLGRSALATIGPLAARDPARVVELQCNLDDASGEAIGFLVGALRERGALDVWTAPITMKKDRPGVVLGLLCREELREVLEDCLFAHSTTLGVRWSLRSRTECERRDFVVRVAGRDVRGQARIRPRTSRSEALTARDLFFEYDDLASLAEERNLSLREVEHASIEAALAALSEVRSRADR